MNALRSVRDALEPLTRRILHAYWRLARGLTLGGEAMTMESSASETTTEGLCQVGDIARARINKYDAAHAPGRVLSRENV